MRHFLISGGIDGKRLFAKGYGDSRPLFRGRHPRNRRIELTILGTP